MGACLLSMVMMSCRKTCKIEFTCYIFVAYMIRLRVALNILSNKPTLGFQHVRSASTLGKATKSMATNAGRPPVEEPMAKSHLEHFHRVLKQMQSLWMSVRK